MTRVLIFITAGIGALFSFWYLIDHQIYEPQLSEIAKIAIFVNHGLFGFSLIIMLYTFFLKNKYVKLLGGLLIIGGLLYLVLMFSFIKPNYFYFIPLGFYLLTGSILLKMNSV